MGENGVALGEENDNYDGSYKIDTNLNKKKKESPNFISQLYLLSIRTKKKMPKLKLELWQKNLRKINAAGSFMNNASGGESVWALEDAYRQGYSYSFQLHFFVIYKSRIAFSRIG